MLYADDIILYKEIKCDLDITVFQSNVPVVVDWVHSVGLKLNNNKTKSLLITRKRLPPILALVVDGMAIETVTSFKYLGVTITNDICWNKHINIVCLKARRLLGFFLQM